MSLRQIDWDEWGAPHNHEFCILNPSWTQLEYALRRLDANRHTLASLVAEDGRQLGVGGGGGHYVLTSPLDDDPHITAQDDSSPPGKDRTDRWGTDRDLQDQINLKPIGLLEMRSPVLGA